MSPRVPGYRFLKMYNSVLRHGRAPFTLGGIGILELFSNPDAIDKDMRTAKNIKLPQDDTGWDRLHLMFSYDEYGHMSPELSQVAQGTMMGTVMGILIGGTNHSKENYINFMQKNQATAFQSHFEAKKQLQNKVTLGFARGAWMWGWRLGLFTGSFICLTTTISVYRGKSSLLEYIAAGGLTGFVYKFKQGPRAWIVGGGLGSALGVFCGSLSLGLMWLTGTSMEEVRYLQYQWKVEHQKERMEMLRKIRTEELDPLGLNRIEKVKETASLDTLDIVTIENNDQQTILKANGEIDLEKSDDDILKS